jgi:Flp pilus assembly pilin Flp
MRRVLGTMQRIRARRPQMLVRFDRANGQTLAEYSLVVTVVAVSLTVLALVVFHQALTGAFNVVTACLDGSC